MLSCLPHFASVAEINAIGSPFRQHCRVCTAALANPRRRRSMTLFIIHTYPVHFVFFKCYLSQVELNKTIQKRNIFFNIDLVHHAKTMHNLPAQARLALLKEIGDVMDTVGVDGDLFMFGSSANKWGGGAQSYHILSFHGPTCCLLFSSSLSRFGGTGCDVDTCLWTPRDLDKETVVHLIKELVVLFFSIGKTSHFKPFALVLEP